MIISEFKKRFYTSIFLIVLTILLINSNLILIYSIIVFGVLSLLEFFNLIQKISRNIFFKTFFNSIFIIYVSIFAIFFLYFSIFLELKIFLFIFLFGCIFSDIGGYIFGNIFKGPKLTRISPKKTISGSVGSFVFTFIIIGASMFYFSDKIGYEVFILSFSTSLFCQLGDLLFSFLKRKAKVKDTGNFLPGHGGILDRLDGIFFGIPFGFLTFLFLYL